MLKDKHCVLIAEAATCKDQMVAVDVACAMSITRRDGRKECPLLNRRDALKAISLAPLSLAADQAATVQRGSTHLTISELEVFHVKVNHRGNWTIARLKTGGGLTGLGDASQSSQGDQTALHFKQFSDLLRGRSIFEIEWFRKVTAPVIAQRGQPAAVAASALEQALWDIRGKAFSVPAYQFFGGRIQERIPLYANINRSTIDRTPDGFAGMAERAVRASFNAVKLAPFDEMPRGLTDQAKIEEFSQKGLACAEAVRKTIGKNRDLLIDVHSRFDLPHGLELARRFEPLRLFWLEEVTASDADLPVIHKAAKMPTAGGESYHGVAGFYPYIKAESVDIVMPDVKVCGGMLELKKIAAICEGAGLFVSPHGPASPVGNVSAAHVVATVPNFNILEFSYGEVPWRAELIEPAEEINQGALVLSDRPGLGITLNEATARRYATA
jgi:galactonate dehydratase